MFKYHHHHLFVLQLLLLLLLLLLKVQHSAVSTATSQQGGRGFYQDGFSAASSHYQKDMQIRLDILVYLERFC